MMLLLTMEGWRQLAIARSEGASGRLSSTLVVPRQTSATTAFPLVKFTQLVKPVTGAEKS